MADMDTEIVFVNKKAKKIIDKKGVSYIHKNTWASSGTGKYVF